MLKTLAKSFHDVFFKSTIIMRFFENLAPKDPCLVEWKSFPKIPLELSGIFQSSKAAFSTEGGSNRRRHETDDENNEDKDALPKLFYIQHPLKYLRNKFDLLRLKLFWDFSFKQREFVYGSTKAVVVMADYIREQNTVEIHNVTTTMGFRQIARDMILSREDPRLHLMRFRFSDIQRAIPIRIHLIKSLDSNYCLVDMFFVGMRRLSDFRSDEASEIIENVRKYDALSPRESNGSRRILFAEIYTRFYREYAKDATPEWAVAFYKVANFDVLSLK